MAHFLVPYIEDYHRPAAWMDLDCLWDDGRRTRSAWNEWVRGLERMGRELDSLNGSVKRSKDAFEVNVDVHGFQPKDLNVSIQDNVLTIEGKHEEKSEDGFSSRHFKRSFTIPENVQREQFKSLLAKDGRTLRIEAPLTHPMVEDKKEEEQKEVPIQVNHVKSAADRG